MALISKATIMPILFEGLMLAAVAAFVVTTRNSYLLSAATSLAYEVYVRYIRPEANSKGILLIAKLAIPLLGLFSYVLLQYFPTILETQIFSYTIYGAEITPAVLAVLLWPQVTKIGGICSMIVGVLSTVIWEVIKPYEVNGATAAIPLAILTLIIISKIASKKRIMPPQVK